jgi:hypothetical protein
MNNSDQWIFKARHLRSIFGSKVPASFREVGCGCVDWIGLGWLRIGTGGGRL